MNAATSPRKNSLTYTRGTFTVKLSAAIMNSTSEEKFAMCAAM